MVASIVIGVIVVALVVATLVARRRGYSGIGGDSELSDEDKRLAAEYHDVRVP